MHFASYFHSLGGMQSVLKQHVAHDRAHHQPANVTVFFDPPNTAQDRVHPLGLTGYHSIRDARRRLGALTREYPGGIAIYHNCWGLPFLADRDASERRLGYLHANPPGTADILDRQKGLLDGMICISPPQRELVTASLPELGTDRLVLLPLPVPDAAAPSPRLPLSHRAVVVGYSGRLTNELKRVDRLVPLRSSLERSGVTFRLEILGDGPRRRWLERRLGNDPSVTFHGAVAGERYRQILADWDFIVFVSDSEGLPNSLLEALSSGVLPLYPRIHTGGDIYVNQVHPDLLYTPEDFQQAARAVQQIQRLPEDTVAELRRRCRELALPHREQDYFSAFYRFVQRIADTPRISSSRFPRRPNYFADFWPFGIASRIYPRALLRQNAPSSET